MKLLTKINLKRDLLVAIIAIVPLLMFGQKKIESNTYLYGNVTQKVESTVLVKYENVDPKTELDNIKHFEKKGLKVISWYELFLPGAEYSEEEFNTAISERDVKTIITIKTHRKDTKDVISTSSIGFGSAYYSNFMIGSSQSTVKEVTNYIEMQMDVFSIENEFKRQTGVMISGKKRVGKMTEKAMRRKVLKRLLDGMDKENAYK